MYLEGLTFAEAEKMVAASLPTWHHHHFVHTNPPYKIRLEDANFEPPGRYRPIVELSDVDNIYGEHFLVVSEVQDLSWFDVLLARVTTLGGDPMDETDLHFVKMQRKPYKDFPKGQSWALDRKMGFQP